MKIMSVYLRDHILTDKRSDRGFKPLLFRYPSTFHFCYPGVGGRYITFDLVYNNVLHAFTLYVRFLATRAAVPSRLFRCLVFWGYESRSHSSISLSSRRHAVAPEPACCKIPYIYI